MNSNLYTDIDYLLVLHSLWIYFHIELDLLFLIILVWPYHSEICLDFLCNHIYVEEKNQNTDPTFLFSLHGVSRIP